MNISKIKKTVIVSSSNNSSLFGLSCDAPRWTPGGRSPRGPKRPRASLCFETFREGRGVLGRVPMEEKTLTKTRHFFGCFWTKHLNMVQKTNHQVPFSSKKELYKTAGAFFLENWICSRTLRKKSKTNPNVRPFSKG